MPVPQGKVQCPDCGITVQGKNLQKHYRKHHPGLDPIQRLKETREKRIRRTHFEAPPAYILGVVAVFIVVGLLVIGTLLVYSLYFEDAEADGTKRDVFFSADDGFVIHATFYSTSKAGAQTIYLIHDIGSDRSVWDDYAKELMTRGYNALAIDLRGHGESVDRIDSEEKLTWEDMGHDDFLDFSADMTAAYRWVQGDNLEGEPNTNVGDEGSMIGIGKGGLYVLNEVVTMARERMMSAVVLSPTLDCYSLDVIQVTEDYGDVRPLVFAYSEGDGTSKLAVDTILELKDDQDESNGYGFYIEGTAKGLPLLDDEDLNEGILQVIDSGWKAAPQ